ncbi:MAG: methyltransferase domain-containing protein [Betaproteobacteria bacterium]|nr:methyltransferase domain-containing protein [Betaproteobacteria bacterium]
MSSEYSQAFYRAIEPGACQSASEIVPELIQRFRPNSVVDVGCGTGSFLSEFLIQGIKDICGIDRPDLDRSLLVIPPSAFQAIDLSRPFNLQRKFDLALCLEVAEHLDIACAEDFISSLCNLAPIIIFSAAIPRQVGVHHVNCQWPEYWQEKFEMRGYQVLDPFRANWISNPRVDWWYAQNTFLAAKPSQSSAEQNPAMFRSSDRLPSIVHPEHYLRVAQERAGAFLEIKGIKKDLERLVEKLAIISGPLED